MKKICINEREAQQERKSRFVISHPILIYSSESLHTD